jgi:hypothetical protein
MKNERSKQCIEVGNEWEVSKGTTLLAVRFLVRHCERKKPSGRPRRRWKHTIEINFNERGCEGVD